MDKRQAVRDSLMEQLRVKAGDIAVFTALIDDYMQLYDEKEQLTEDINTRGISFKEENTRGVEIWKENASLRSKIMVHKQMLAILDKLGLSVEGSAQEDDDCDL